MMAVAATNGPARISQLLPTVKCSSCNAPVPVNELGDHVCAKPPPVPTLPRPAMSPTQATALLPQRLQNLVDSKLNTSVSSSSSSSAPRTTSPLRSRSPQPSFMSKRSSGASSSPSTARPSLDSYRGQTPQPQPSFAPPPRPSTQSPAPTPTLRVGARRPSVTSPTLPRSPHPPGRPHHQPQQSYARSIREEDVDTKSGGEAGMAGVGRRGFAAAARAAMFVSGAPAPGEHSTSLRRPNAPTFLDIDSATSTSHGTPPLSAGSGSYSSHSHSPVSPSPLSTAPPRIPTPEILPSAGLSRLPFLDKMRANSAVPLPETPSTAKVAPPVRKSSRDVPERSLSGKSTNTSTSSSSYRWARRDEEDDRDGAVSPTASSGSEYGLAYADSTDYEDEDEDEPRNKRGTKPPPLSLNNNNNPSTSASILRSGSNGGGNNRIKFAAAPPKMGHKKSSSSVSSSSSAGGDLNRSNSSKIAQAFGLSQTPPRGGPGTPVGRHRSGGSSSAYSKSSAGGGYFNLRESEVLDDHSPGSGLDRLEGLRKSKSSVTTSNGKHPEFHRSNTVQNTRTTPEANVSVVRAKTDGTAAGKNSGKPRLKICLKCQKRIEDGRWIQNDGGGVLCERCWKNMYLPKCRRCNLPIEKQAVSSSDGQLKGKYHKECFNCFTCNKPFPDKTFYVYDGKPLCAYHYHEANDSLCCASTCGQPIEGPCAVSHSGDRYHPEHFVCESAGCRERLEEYWEVGGKMLCERHARRTDEYDDDWAGERAMKRKTRFIDLAGFGGSGLR